MIRLLGAETVRLLSLRSRNYLNSLFGIPMLIIVNTELLNSYVASINIFHDQYVRIHILYTII